jgi:predicted molibdopterin-dependent oxidoreductase YjgC
MADVHLAFRPGTDAALLNGMMNVIINEGLIDAEFINKRTESYEAMRATAAKYTPEIVEVITGVSAELIKKAARIYARARRGSICYAMGLTQHTTGTDNVKAICNLALLTGNLGKPGAGVNPLRGQNNVQGACDMGALPNVFPGYQGIDNKAAREKFEQAWGVTLPGEKGLTLTGIIRGADHGDIKGLFILGENPMMSEPDLHHAEKALENLEFLVVQDIFLTETAQKADVVLPGVSFAEKDGTFTNTERRVQRVRKAISPRGEARPDWQILCDLSRRMGYIMDYSGPEEIFEEIAMVTPSYAGMSYSRLEGRGLQWPCPDKDHPGTPYLHIKKFNRGLGLFHPIEFREAYELPDKEYPFILSTGRTLYHYHTGTMTRRAKALNEKQSHNIIQVNPGDAKRLNIANGEMVRVFSRRGSIMLRVHLTDDIPPGVLFTYFHFAEAPANILTQVEALDPVAGIPEYKVTAARLEKISYKN